MAWTQYQILIAILMVFTGSINTIATKWADKVDSLGRDGKVRPFNHPYVQTLAMFLGEFCCLITFKILYFYNTKKKNLNEEELPYAISGNRDYNPLIFWLPAACDMIASSTMYVGLTMTYASSYQMLRGALIVFTGLLSVAFLNRRLKTYQWVGIFVLILGLFVIGLVDIINESGGKINNIITGDLLIIMAQIMTAIQMVVEEKFITGSNVSPLEAVGWEGFFGFITLSILLLPLNNIYVGQLVFKNPNSQIEDVIDAFTQMKNNWQIIASLVGTIVSIAFFNFAGISVTKQLSATTRTVLDSVRTLFIWLFSLSIGWQLVNLNQLIVLVGFMFLISGMFLYNNVIIRPFLISKGIIRNSDENEQQPIVNSESAEA